MPTLFGPGGIFDQGFDLGPFVTGTNSTDYFLLNHDYTTTVNLLGGNDRLWLYGHGDYEVDLGSGHDHVYVRGLGNVEVDAGSGLDRVYVEEMGTHDLDGGAGVDRLDFSKANHGISFWQNRFSDINEEEPISVFSNFENVVGSKFADKFVSVYDEDNVWSLGDGDNYAELGGGTDIVYGGAGWDTIVTAWGERPDLCGFRHRQGYCQRKPMVCRSRRPARLL
ncbi:hypothetical protein Q5Y75_21420 [Ruegeria sp. 2205SS24-7]|uniref:hypothetical protein n=1 Tax=Ruegeria discodermiae TaxID=3064389 RepID=UPI0027410E0C|nr:hypothetical protein [Ruegeria sp. 2205SS24-7]MDP5219790.1 hypothetical protein [Ruegeria sp. 2205SS24-7]